MSVIFNDPDNSNRFKEPLFQKNRIKYRDSRSSQSENVETNLLKLDLTRIYNELEDIDSKILNELTYFIGDKDDLDTAALLDDGLSYEIDGISFHADQMPDVLSEAVLWIDAEDIVHNQQLFLNKGTGGSILNARSGATDYPSTAYIKDGRLRLPGLSTDYVQAADSMQTRITGDLEIICRLSLDDWSTNSIQSLVSKYHSTGQRGYLFALENDRLGYYFNTTDGTSVLTASRTFTNVAGSTPATGFVTYTTNVSHGFIPGDTVSITGLSIAGYNGVFKIISTPTPSSFVVSNQTTGATGLSGSLVGISFSSLVSDGSPCWIKVVHDVDNGSNQNVVSFWFAPDSDIEPVTWKQVGNNFVFAGAASIFPSNANFLIGVHSSAQNPAAGYFYNVIVRSGEVRETVVDIDFSKYDDWTVSFVEASDYKSVFSIISSNTTTNDPVELPHYGENYLYTPGSINNYASLPKTWISELNGIEAEHFLSLHRDVSHSFAYVEADPQLSIIEDVEICCRVALDNWNASITQTFMSKGYSGEFYVGLSLAGNLFFNFLAAGTLRTNGVAWPSSLRPKNGQPIWFKFTRYYQNGICSFYTAPDQSEEPTDWTLVGSTTGYAGQATSTSSNVGFGAGVQTPGYVGGERMTGKFYRGILKRNVGGKVIVDADFTKADIGVRSFNCTTGQRIILQAPSINIVDGTTFLYNSGLANSFATVSDHPNLRITGDIEMIAKVRLSNWIPSNETYLFGKYNFDSISNNNRAYLLGLYSSANGGRITMRTSVDGVTSIVRDPGITAPFINGKTYWIRTVVDVDDGAGNNVTYFYYAEDEECEPTVWNLLGISTQVGTTSIFGGFSEVQFGNINFALTSTNNFNGKFYRAIVRRDPFGTPITELDVNFARQVPNSTGFRDGSRNANPVVIGALGCAVERDKSFELVLRAAADDWSPSTALLLMSASGNDSTVTSNVTTFGTGRGFRLWNQTAGTLQFDIYINGSAVSGYTGAQSFVSSIPVPFADFKTYWIKVTANFDNGIGQTEVNFYYAEDQKDEPTDWIRIGDPRFLNLYSSIPHLHKFFSEQSGCELEFGSGISGQNSSSAAASFYRAIIRNGIGGEEIVDVDFTEGIKSSNLNTLDYYMKSSELSDSSTTIKNLGTAGDYLNVKSGALYNVYNSGSPKLLKHTGTNYIYMPGGTNAVNTLYVDSAAGSSTDITGDLAIAVKMDRQFPLEGRTLLQKRQSGVDNNYQPYAFGTWAPNSLGGSINYTFYDTKVFTITGVAASTPAVGTVQYTTSTAHSYSVGEYVTISGITPSGYSGTFLITATTSTTFDVTNATTGAATLTNAVTGLHVIYGRALIHPDFLWVGVIHDVDDGSNQNIVHFYASKDGVNWILLESRVEMGVVTRRSNAARIYVNSSDVGAYGNIGKFYQAKVWNSASFAGNPVLHIDAEKNFSSENASTFTATTGQTVNIVRGTSGRKINLVTRSKWNFGTSDYLHVDDSPYLNFAKNQSFTVFSAIRQFATITDGHPIITKQSGTLANGGYRIIYHSGTTGYLFGIGDKTNAVSTGAVGSTLGNISCIAGIRNVSLKKVGISVNNSNISYVNDTTTGDIDSEFNLRIGSFSGGGNFQSMELYGSAIWDRALTQPELKLLNDHYQGAKSQQSINLLKEAIFWIDAEDPNKNLLQIHRSASGKKTVAVTRPVLLFGTNSYLNIPESSLLDFSLTDSFSILAIVRQWGTPSADYRIAMKWNASVGWYMGTGASSKSTSFIVQSGAANLSSSTKLFKTGELNCVYGIRNVINDNVVVYMNESPGIFYTDNTIATLDNSDSLTIGRQNTGPTAYADMEFIGFLIWRRALTADEVEKISQYFGSYSTTVRVDTIDKISGKLTRLFNKIQRLESSI